MRVLKILSPAHRVRCGLRAYGAVVEAKNVLELAQTHGQSSLASSKPHLLLVDDEPDVFELIRRYFASHGFRVSGAPDGVKMRELIAQDAPDLVLLDLGLPGEDGLVLIRYLAQHWGGPVIIVTGRGDPVDRVVGLEIGADDYVSKPFDLRELLARVRSVLRRVQAVASPSVTDSTWKFAGFELEMAARTLRRVDGVEVPLTTGEFDLLKVFVEQPQRVLSRDQLMNALHGRVSGPFDRAIDVQISRLRRKIETDPASPELLKSVRGAGYTFATTVIRAARRAS